MATSIYETIALNLSRSVVRSVMMVLFLLLLVTPIPKAEPISTIAVVKGTPVPAELIVLKSNGQQLHRFDLPKLEGKVVAIRLSPDANLIAIQCQLAIKDGLAVAGRIRPPSAVHILPLDQDHKTTKKIVANSLAVPSINWGDNKSLMVVELDQERALTTLETQPLPYRAFRINRETGQKTEVEWPSTHAMADLSRDAETALTCVRPCGTAKADELAARAYLVDVKTRKATLIKDSSFVPYRFSADGQSVIGMGFDGPKRVIQTIDVKTKAVHSEFEVTSSLDRLLMPHACFDGTRPIVGWHESFKLDDESTQTAYRYRIGTTAPNRINRKTFFATETNETIQAFDVR